MKKKLFLSLLVLGLPLVLLAQNTATGIKKAGQLPVKKVSFNGAAKSPFMSQKEIDAIEARKEAEQKRINDEIVAKRKAEQEAIERAQRKQMLCEELKRYPSRIIRKGIQIDGILGKDAIVNGQVVSRGTKIDVQLKNTKVKLTDTEEIEVSKLMEECGFNTKKLKVKVVDVTDNSVWFVYKGERFQVKLPLL